MQSKTVHFSFLKCWIKFNHFPLSLPNQLPTSLSFPWMYMYVCMCIYAHVCFCGCGSTCACLYVELRAQPLLLFLVLLSTLFKTGSVIGWSSPVSASLPGQQTPGIYLTPASPSLGSQAWRTTRGSILWAWGSNSYLPHACKAKCLTNWVLFLSMCLGYQNTEISI